LVTFSVGTPINNDLLTYCAKLNKEILNNKVTEFYGSIPLLNLSVRETARLNNINISDFKEHVKKCHDNNIMFAYTINSPITTNTFSNFKTTIDNVYSAEVDSIFLASPYLIEYTRHTYPSLKIKASTVLHIDSIRKIKFYLQMGTDIISLSLMKNRDFQFLKNISKEGLTNKIELLVNEACNFECPWRDEHYISEAKNLDCQYYLKKCFDLNNKDYTEFIKAPWIAPWDILHYKRLGFNNFKITGRTFPVDKIKVFVKAYMLNDYNGNLLDLFPLLKGKTETSFNLNNNVFIDCQELKNINFLNYFLYKNITCENICGTNSCNYCSSIADKVIKR